MLLNFVVAKVKRKHNFILCFRYLSISEDRLSPQGILKEAIRAAGGGGGVTWFLSRWLSGQLRAVFFVCLFWGFADVKTSSTSDLVNSYYVSGIVPGNFISFYLQHSSP